MLQATVLGNEILNTYEKCKYLDPTQQNGITRIIVDHFILKNMKMSSTEMIRASKAVVELFPSEHEATYYLPRHGKAKPSGKIYDRYCNVSYKNKLNESNSKKARLECKSPVECLANYDDLISKKSILKYNEPSNLFEIWKETAELRMKEEKSSLYEIFQNWPLYKNANGCELIDMDFDHIHPTKGKCLFEKIDAFMIEMELYFDKNIKDKLNLFKLKNFKNPRISIGMYV